MAIPESLFLALVATRLLSQRKSNWFPTLLLPTTSSSFTLWLFFKLSSQNLSVTYWKISLLPHSKRLLSFPLFFFSLAACFPQEKILSSPYLLPATPKKPPFPRQQPATYNQKHAPSHSPWQVSHSYCIPKPLLWFPEDQSRGSTWLSRSPPPGKTSCMKMSPPNGGLQVYTV